MTFAFAFLAGACVFCALARCDALRKIDGGVARSVSAFPASEALSSVPEKRAGTLRFASINLFNYLSTNRRTDDGVYKRHWAKPRSEREALRRLILAVNPDVLAVQEIGGRKQLDQLARDLEDAGGGAFSHRVLLCGRDTHRHVALLSRLPFREIFRFPERDAMSRGLLGAEVSAPGMRPIRIFTLHLKSKITRDESDPECAAERLAEARRACELLRRVGGNACALLGDFNDEPGSEPVRVLTEDGFLRRLDSRDSSGARWTYSNSKYGYRSIFDHVFLSSALRGEGRVADEALSRVRASFGGIVSASDHRMVFCDVSFSNAATPESLLADP